MIGLQASKPAVTPLLKAELGAKGYRVVAEDVGIFSDPRFKERWVFPADGEFSDSAA